MSTTIAPRELRALMAGDELFALIDVREWGEFSLEQILGSRCVVRGSLEKYLPFLVPNADVTLVLVCNDGRRSRLAAATAESLGYHNVTLLAGGLDAWKEGGGETYSGWSLTGKDYGERLLVEEQLPEISVQDLHARIAAGAPVHILDSRPRSEFRASHLPGARSAPIGQLPFEITDLVSDRQTPVVTNCAGRTRSIIAAHLLRRMRIANPVYALRGGTGAWRIAGWAKELETGGEALGPPASERSRAAAEELASRLAREDQIVLLRAEELRAQINAGKLTYVLDVRLAEEYAAEHIAGARLCPGTQVQFAVDALVGVANATVVTACDGRVRATVAASILKGMGYRNVCVLDGGIADWKARGFAVESGPPVEIDYGQPGWLARFLQDWPASLGAPRELSVRGLDAARSRVRRVASRDLAGLAGSPTPVKIIDVRSAGEFAAGHIPGALWLSRGWLELKIEVEVPDRSAPVVAYCRRGVESVMAEATLFDSGYTNVAALEGGFESWRAASQPVEEGLSEQTQYEEIASAEVGLFGTGRYGYSNERMARYLKDEEALGRRHHRRPVATEPQR
jgi:rhodanese-related sulfurtransferase